VGGNERLLAKSLRKAGCPYHLAPVNKVRSFARAKGYLAKTDKIGAKTIREYGLSMGIKPDEDRLSLAAERRGDLLKRREQLIADKKREDNRLEQANSVESKQSITSHLSWIKKALKKIEEQLAKVRQSSIAIEKTVALFVSIPGVGELVASHVVAFLPELGHANPKNIAALVGVAPFNRDSGRYKGKRFIQGGRRMLRRVLYMAAVASIRWNPDLKRFYQRLREQGKPAKVALIAVTRKRLMLLRNEHEITSRFSSHLHATLNGCSIEKSSY